MVTLFKKIVLWYAFALRFAYNESVSQFNVNLMIHFNEVKGYQKIRAMKHLSLKIQEATSNVVINEKREKQYVRQIIYSN